MLRLVLEAANGTVQKLPLADLGTGSPDGLCIGRAGDNGIVLRWPGVSKHHARLRVDGDDLWLEDRDSKNGLRFDGERLARIRLEPGRSVQLGAGFLRLESIETSEAEIGLRFPQTTSASVSSASAGVLADTGLLGSTDALARPPLELPPGTIESRSPRLVRLHDELARAARADLPILLQGPTGVGKEVYARAVHRSGPRRDGPFVVVHADAIPPEQLEAELFGIERDVATGVAARPGLVREARGGTLFFDEIGDLPLPFQGKLLRVLQEHRVRPVGGRREESVDFGVVAATHRDLRAAVEAATFRQDLFYRLAGFEARLPTLAERIEDLEPLVEHFACDAALRLGVRIAGLSRRALDRLRTEPWPGNLRQLRWSVQGAVARARDGEVLESRHFGAAEANETTEADPTPASPAPLADPPELEAPRPLQATLDAAERRALVDALRWADGNKTRAAEVLGISRAGLRMKLKRLGIDPDTP